MLCKNCGKEIDDGSKFCAECGERIETETVKDTAEETVVKNEPFAQKIPESPENNAVEVLKVTRIITNGDLSIYADRIEFSYLRDNKPVSETYHYFNIKKASVDNGLKVASLVIETIDDNKMFFTINNENSFDVYTQKAEFINQMKAACPALELLGLTDEDMKKELNENKEKRKGKTVKKIENFISEYKSFGTLTKKNKIIHLAIPLLIVIILFNLFSGGGESNEDFIIRCAQTVAYEQLKSPSTASFSDGQVVEKDDYGRALVTFFVDAENSFGAYVRTYYAIVIETYDKSTEKFTYNSFAVQHWSNGTNSDFYLEAAKVAANWDEPLED